MNEQNLNTENIINEDGDSRQVELLVMPPPNYDLFGEIPVRSISFNETEIINNILRLHVEGGQIDLDPTYSIGNFYKPLSIKPKHKFDICPQIEGVLQADSRQLPFGAGEIKSIMFDPPFVIGGANYETNKEGSSIIAKRFGNFTSWEELQEMYSSSLQEFYRILAPNGVLIFKCQDVIVSSKQYISHVYIINEAVRIGFYCKDLFVYCVRVRITDVRVQQHARKYHSYYLVFKKTNTKINYWRTA